MIDNWERLEQIRFQKKENHKELKAVERCIERDGSLVEAELEILIPVMEMRDLSEVAEEEVPEKPCWLEKLEELPEKNGKDGNRVEMIVEESALAADDVTVTEMQEYVTEDDVAETDPVYDVREEQVAEPDMLFDSNDEDMNYRATQSAFVEEVKLPMNKTDYMEMSVAKKVLCYLFEENSTEELFNMVRDYFASVGLDTSFHSIYEEYKLLVNYYEVLYHKTL